MGTVVLVCRAFVLFVGRSAGVEYHGEYLLNILQTFLLFQTADVTAWSRALEDSRSAYSSLREHLLRYIENPDEVGSALDPLDDDQNVGHSSF